MSEDFGPNFISLTDEDGNEFELEYIDALELDGQTYMAFFPAVEEDEAEDEDLGLVILKSIMVDGEERSPRWTATRSSSGSMTCLWSNCWQMRKKIPEKKSKFLFSFPRRCGILTPAQRL